VHSFVPDAVVLREVGHRMSGHPQAGLPLVSPVLIEAAPVLPVDWLDVLPRQVNCLRDYQRRQIAELAQALRTYLRILMQAPTGAGKTHIIAAVVMAAASSGLRVLVLATRTRLVRQIHERLAAFEVRHGVIAAALPELRNYNAAVQVASADTLYRRAIVAGKIPLPWSDVVIFDEAHLATADSRLRILQSYPAAVHIGFTATPARKSGKALGAPFDCMVLGPTIKALTASGVLVRCRVFNTPIVSDAELKALPMDADGDFKAAPTAELLTRPKLIGDVVNNWLRIANRKKTLCFAVTKAHGAALCYAFRQEGVAAELVTDSDDEQMRESAISRLEAGDTHVLINCFLLSYGIDIPSVECVVLARPTRSLTMYLQMVGRGLRAAPGKDQCILIDHGHVVENLGVPHADFAWSLDPASNANAVALKSASAQATRETIRTCSECSELWLTSEQGNACPSCGWVAPPRSKSVTVEEADLQELTDEEDACSPQDPHVMSFFRESCGWYARRWADRWRETPGKGRGWAWRQTATKFHFAEGTRIPSHYWRLTTASPSAEVSGWLKSRMIRWAMSRRKGTVT
jgi:DNA repair protein RadD